VQQHAAGVEHRGQGGGGVGQPLEHGVDDGLRGDLAAPYPVLRGADGLLHQRAAQPGDGEGDRGLGQHGVGARHAAARVGHDGHEK
jgi:hypothetical protein